jgi:glyoxylase-like metal-dependent hydrolase (beta-lactamase superfamily II)
MPRYRVISIGTLARNTLWNEREPIRMAHATTTLIESDDALIVVDPSLPAPVLAARIHERSGRPPSDVTHVFCTGFSDDLVGGIDAFPEAMWMCSAVELEHAAEALEEDMRGAERHEEAAALKQLQRLKAVHDKMNVCPDNLVSGVDLFPLPGVRPGTAGLLLSQPTRTVLIAGDAVATSEHLEKGQILQDCFDHEAALASLTEAIEIADIIVPGRDNVVLNPLRAMRGGA